MLPETTQRVIDQANNVLEKSCRTIDSAWEISIQAKETIEKSKAHIAKVKKEPL
jgi:hypothetical protein